MTNDVFINVENPDVRVDTEIESPVTNPAVEAEPRRSSRASVKVKPLVYEKLGG